MVSNEERVELQAKKAYETYWQGLGSGHPTPWWSLNEVHRERWRNVIRAVKKVRKWGVAA